MKQLHDDIGWMRRNAGSPDVVMDSAPGLVLSRIQHVNCRADLPRPAHRWHGDWRVIQVDKRLPSAITDQIACAVGSPVRNGKARHQVQMISTREPAQLGGETRRCREFQCDEERLDRNFARVRNLLN
jgi:hypothetical protein